MNEEIRKALIRVMPFVLILCVLLFRIRQKKINPHDLGINKPSSAGRYFFWTAGFLVFILLTELVLYKMGLLETNPWNHPLFSSVIRISGAVLLAPVAEELIFRGVIMNALMKRKLNLHLAIFLQAVFFVLLHNFTWENTVSSNIGVVQSLIDASLFAYARYHTNSIYTPITMHMTGNIIATLERFIL